MDDLESYYDVLETPQSATPDEIKKAFHKLANEYHPDKNVGATEKVKHLGEQKFKEISEAYDVLKDVRKRKQYDDKLKAFKERKQAAERTSNTTHNAGHTTYNTGSPKTNTQPPKQKGNKLTKRQKSWIIYAGIILFIIIIANSNSSGSSSSPVSTYSIATPPNANIYVSSGSGQYQLPNGTFSLYFPDKPTYRKDNQYLLSNQQDYVTDATYSFASEDNSYGLEGTYINSAFTGLQNTPEENLKNELSYTANDNGNKLISSNPTTYEGFPAIDYIAMVNNSAVYFVGRDILKGNDLYMVEYYYNSATTTEDKQLENKFLNSLSFYNAADYSYASLPSYVDTTKPPPETNDQICKDRNGAFATYDSSSSSCSCATGYILDKTVNQCVTPLLYCQNQQGLNATYDSTTNSCGCADGYYYGSVSKQCVSLVVSRNESCSTQYPNTSFLEYSTDGKTNICDCNTGYYWNGSKTACMSQSALNQECVASYGTGSYSTTNNTGGKNICDCSYGYSWNAQNNQCVTTSSINDICVRDVGRNSYYLGTVSNGKYNCSTPY